MDIALLYGTVVLIWGTTWFAIELQLGPVAEELSVAYRFGLGSLGLFAFARITNTDLRVRLADYPIVMIMGVLLFSGAYLCVYYGTGYLASGLVAVLFSLIIICNAILERFFFGTPIDARLGLAALTGIVGTALVFGPELGGMHPDPGIVAGIAWTLASILIASFGNMAAISATSRGLPVATVNAHAMAWGSLASLAVALALDRPLNFSMTPAYVSSLLFLAIFGSAVAFGCYLALLKRIGSARASYSSVLYPVVALLVSSLFEGYRWTVPALAGLLLILAGNWLALTRARTARITTEQERE